MDFKQTVTIKPLIWVEGTKINGYYFDPNETMRGLKVKTFKKSSLWSEFKWPLKKILKFGLHTQEKLKSDIK